MNDTNRELQFVRLGNGISVYDTSHINQETKDYPTVAHISDEGKIRYYTEDLTNTDKNKISTIADKERNKFKAEWDSVSDSAKLYQILIRTNDTQLLQINNENLSVSEKVAKYEKSVIFGLEPFPQSEPLSAKNIINEQSEMKNNNNTSTEKKKRRDDYER